MFRWKKFRSALLVFALLLAILSLSTAASRRVKAVAAEALAPYVKAVGAVTGALRRALLNARSMGALREENRRLRRRVRLLEKERNELTEASLERERLRELLRFAGSLPLDTLPARVVGRDVTDWYRSVLIDRGEKDGVKQNMAIVAAEGVVGKVVESMPSAARVLLLVDRTARVGAVVQETRDTGIVQGMGGRLKMNYLPKASKVAPGDLVLTSGFGGVYPKGLPVGEVTAIGKEEGDLYLSAELSPAVRFGRLEEVLVILGPPSPGREWE